jgi:hypothetical protein
MYECHTLFPRLGSRQARRELDSSPRIDGCQRKAGGGYRPERPERLPRGERA